MKTPTLKEVKERFKNADIVKENCYGEVEFKVDLKKLRISAFGNYVQGDTNLYLWSEDYGYAKILSYKKPKEETYKIKQEAGMNYITINDVKYIKEDKETFLISKAQIEIIAGCSIASHDYIKAIFPSVFKEEKKELVVGRWYWYKGTLFNYQLENNVYGFNENGSWCNVKNWSWPVSFGYDREATPKEVEEALIKEAVKIGYKKGICIRAFYSDGEEYNSTNILEENKFSFHEDTLNIDGYRIFLNGKWAEIIPTLTIQEAEEKLGVKIV